MTKLQILVLKLLKQTFDITRNQSDHGNLAEDTRAYYLLLSLTMNGIKKLKKDKN